MFFLFSAIVPLIINFLIIIIISSIVKKAISHKPANKNTIQTYNGRNYNAGSNGNFNMSKPNLNTTIQKPKVQKSTINVSNEQSEQQKYDLHRSFKNTEFDTYRAKGLKKDFVSGYDKKYSDGTVRHYHSENMQYSHTYDGHEPWDSCLPKEKDPWDKDFKA